MPNERCPNRLRCIDRNTSTEKRKDKETIIIINICSQTTNMSSTATFATFAKQVMTSSCSKLLLFKLLFWRKISLRMINRNFVSASSASIRGRPLLDPVSHSMGPDKGYRPRLTVSQLVHPWTRQFQLLVNRNNRDFLSLNATCLQYSRAFIQGMAMDTNLMYLEGIHLVVSTPCMRRQHHRLVSPSFDRL